MTGEPHEVRLRRLRMRSWRRGMREMDLLLGPFADAELAALGAAALEIYEELLAENDQDLYGWMARRDPAPARYHAIVLKIVAHHGIA